MRQRGYPHHKSNHAAGDILEICLLESLAVRLDQPMGSDLLARKNQIHVALGHDAMAEMGKDADNAATHIISILKEDGIIPSGVEHTGRTRRDGADLLVTCSSTHGRSENWHIEAKNTQSGSGTLKNLGAGRFSDLVDPATFRRELGHRGQRIDWGGTAKEQVASAKLAMYCESRETITRMNPRLVRGARTHSEFKRRIEEGSMEHMVATTVGANYLHALGKAIHAKFEQMDARERTKAMWAFLGTILPVNNTIFVIRNKSGIRVTKGHPTIKLPTGREEVRTELDTGNNKAAGFGLYVVAGKGAQKRVVMRLQLCCSNKSGVSSFALRAFVPEGTR